MLNSLLHGYDGTVARLPKPDPELYVYTEGRAAEREQKRTLFAAFQTLEDDDLLRVEMPTNCLLAVIPERNPGAGAYFVTEGIVDPDTEKRVFIRNVRARLQ